MAPTLHLLLRERTIAEVLRDKVTRLPILASGTWDFNSKKPTPDEHGFAHWFATWSNAGPSHEAPNFIRNGDPVGPLKGYSCQLVVDEAIDWLDQLGDQDQPFFLNVWFHEPHAPITLQSLGNMESCVIVQRFIQEPSITQTKQLVVCSRRGR